jgi:DNA polymerase III subunit gamma/tau
MSYVVLARKYRPRSFAQMVGQEHVVRALGNALTQQRLHHAYLFTGTRGIGKTTVSRILAKSLNCTGADGQGGITAEPCGVCQACTEIDADRYLDYIEMDAASNGGKDEIKDLIERAAYKPGVGRFKVFMIDEAHQLSKDAFNALLKTLEEPPEYLKFVLATTDPEKMLPTVLSRCLQFNLRPMAPEVVHAHLAQVLGAEGVGFEAGALKLLSRAARGSMRDALSLTDQAIAYGAGRLDEAVVRTMLGAVDRGHAARLVEALSRRDGAALLAAVDGLRGLGLSSSATLEEMAALLQQMAVEQAVPGALDAADPDTEDSRRLAPMMAPDETQLLYSIVVHGRAELSLMSDEYGALTMVLLRLLAFPPVAGPPSPALAAGRQPAASASQRAPAPAAAVAASVDAQRGMAAAGPLAAAPSPASPAASAASAASAAAVSTAASAPLASPGTAAAMSTLTSAAAAPAAPRAPAEPAASAARRAPAEPPPWLDEPPDEGVAPEPRAKPLRAAAAPTLSLPVLMAAEPTPAASPTPVPAALGDRWSALVRRLAEAGSISALVRELAWQGGLRDVDDSAAPPRWTLVVERESLRSPALCDKLAAALTTEIGVAVELRVEPGVPADSPARRDHAERLRRQAEAEAVIGSDPLVAGLLAQFKGARIVPGSIKPI